MSIRSNVMSPRGKHELPAEAQASQSSALHLFSLSNLIFPPNLQKIARSKLLLDRFCRIRLTAGPLSACLLRDQEAQP